MVNCSVNCIWNKEAVRQDFKDANIVHIYRKKGGRSNCDNHLTTAGKVLSKISK